MALNPTFVIRIAASIAELKANLAEGRGHIETTTAAMGKLANSLNGNKLVQYANDVVAAINQVGAATLSAGQNSKYLDVLERAMEKLRLTGQAVPPEMSKMADTLRANVQPATEGWSLSLSKVSGLLASFGVTLTIGALVSFGKSIINSADALVKMHDKTGLSIEGLQRMQVVGDDAGVSLDSMTSSINMFQKRLGGDDKSAVAALRELNIDIENLKDLDGEGQFYALGEAIIAIEDPLKQMALGTAVFGRSFAELLPVMKAGFDDVKGKVVGMSEDSVRALDRFSDDSAAAWRRTKGHTGEAIGFILKSYQLWKDSGGDVIKGLGLLEQKNKDVAQAMYETAKAAGPFSKLKYVPPELPKDLDEVYDKLQLQTEAFNKNNKASAAAADVMAQYGIKIRAIANEIGLAQMKMDHDAQEAWKHMREETGTLEKAFGHLKTVAEDNRKEFMEWKGETQTLNQWLGSVGVTVKTIAPEVDALATKTGMAAQAFGALSGVISGVISSKAGLSGVSSSVVGLASGIGTAAVAGSAWGTAMAKAGLAGTVALGAVTLGIGAAAVGVGLLIKKWAGVSAAEKEAREIVADYAATITAALDPTQKMEAGNDAWKRTVIALRDSYAKLGLTTEDALKDAEKLWNSSKDGVNGTKKVIEEINSKQMKAFIANLRTTFDETQKNEAGTDDWRAVVVFLRDAYARMGKSVDEATSDADALFGSMIAGGEETADVIAAIIKKLGDIPTKKNVDINVDVNYDEHGRPDFDSAELGFAGGTRGRYLDFGSGTPVTLHGRERVMTESEGRSQAMSTAAMESELRAIKKLLEHQAQHGARQSAIALHDMLAMGRSA